MISKPCDRKTIKTIANLIETSAEVVITCHVKPDGDAIGSSLALYHVLSALGKKVAIVTPDQPPHYLRFLPGSKLICAASADEEFAKTIFDKADLIFCLDFNAIYRVDKLAGILEGALCPKILIDHHLSPEPFADVMVSSPVDSSTCFLLFKVLCCLGLKPLIDKAAAMCLAAGMMTDTGNFSYNANDPELYMAMAQLLTCGIDKVSIWERLNIKTESQLRLNSFALYDKMKILHGGKVALITLTTDELKRFNYKKGDNEGLVNVPLQIPEVILSVFMHEEPDFIKVSMRSKGVFPANTMCDLYFDGGGHLNAAGGEFRGSLQECEDRLIEVLPQFNDYFYPLTNNKEK